MSAVSFDAAVARVRDGGLVAYPTETVWGLGADASRDAAVAALRDLKGRAEDAPISVLVDAHQGAPDLPDAQLHLGLAYRDAGRTAEARALLAAVGTSENARPELRASAREALDSLP